MTSENQKQDHSNVDSLRKTADNVYMVLASRLMAAVGVPMAAMLFYQVWGGIQDLQKSAREFTTAIAVIESRLTAHDVAITGLQGRVQNMDDRLLFLFRNGSPPSTPSKPNGG